MKAVDERRSWLLSLKVFSKMNKERTSEVTEFSDVLAKTIYKFGECCYQRRVSWNVKQTKQVQSITATCIKMRPIIAVNRIYRHFAKPVVPSCIAAPVLKRFKYCFVFVWMECVLVTKAPNHIHSTRQSLDRF